MNKKYKDALLLVPPFVFLMGFVAWSATHKQSGILQGRAIAILTIAILAFVLLAGMFVYFTLEFHKQHHISWRKATALGFDKMANFEWPKRSRK